MELRPFNYSLPPSLRTSAVAGALVAAALLVSAVAQAEVPAKVVEQLGAPASISTGFGPLTFKDGVPTAETAEKTYDILDFNQALAAYNNSFRGASALALVKGFESIGAKPGDVVIFSKLMDSHSLFLTANADTVYYLTGLDLSKGPVVVEQPSDAVGTINDMWFSWIIDIGGPGPDRGLGGKYLIVGPDYDGPLPEGGYFIGRSKTNFALYAARAYLKDNDPKPAVENIRKTMKVYPYQPGAYGSSLAQALDGKVRIAPEPKIPETKFIEGSGLSFNTIPPSDIGFFELINENVQMQPATSYDVELAGQLAAIGIVHGKPFNPDARMKKILSDAAAFGQATGRALNWRYAMKHPDWAYYKDSRWGSMLWQGGAFFETPPPVFEAGVFKPLPPTGARTLDSRTAFYYGYTLDSPGMIMRVPGIGSQYLMSFLDPEGNPFDGAKTYKVVLPPHIPAAAFWSLTLYDNQTRSMLQTPQNYPRAGSQGYPSPAAEAAADGTTTIWFGPTQPQGVARANWIQTMPGKGWFTILRLYSPLPSFFDKSWRVGEIETVK
ncbi:DUF1254 domain-containing protein [Xanthobacter aminoxidans]|uniref:DUF1254 domain-containing protein n=1 Tax=Xanthobacter aminoxidans TaxID=186280 RepID=A0ABW6ZD13_9HYPH